VWWCGWVDGRMEWMGGWIEWMDGRIDAFMERCMYAYMSNQTPLRIPNIPKHSLTSPIGPDTGAAAASTAAAARCALSHRRAAGRNWPLSMAVQTWVGA
jgi:hypothetical protein